MDEEKGNVMSRTSSFGEQQFYGVTSEASFEKGTVFVIMSFDENIASKSSTSRTTSPRCSM